MHVIGADVDTAGLQRLEEALRARGQSIETRRTDEPVTAASNTTAEEAPS